MYRHGLKRIIDFIFIFMALLIVGPILLFITLWLHFANKGEGGALLKSVQARMEFFFVNVSHNAFPQ